MPPKLFEFKILPWMAILSVATVSVTLANEFPAAGDASDRLPSFLEKHCVRCHGQDATEGDVDLTSIDRESLTQNADLTQQLTHVLYNREMPPEEEPQPTPEARAALLELLNPILH